MASVFLSKTMSPFLIINVSNLCNSTASISKICLYKGGVVLDRNTDAIRYSSKKEIIINQFWDDKETIKKYDTEEPRALENETLPRLQRTKILDYEVFNLEWNTDRKSVV